MNRDEIENLNRPLKEAYAYLRRIYGSNEHPAMVLLATEIAKNYRNLFTDEGIGKATFWEERI